ncbi:glutathione synthase [Pelagibacteraceae bacterium]|nr:glutathione synthase [Pelagibacteraceae bacterium]
MKYGFQIDPVHTLNHDTDSTLPMILESQKRKNRNFIFSPRSLTFKKNTVYALVKEIKFKNNKLNSYIISSEKILNLNSLNCIFIRQDPPYNMEYISSMHLLEQLNPKTKVINSPAGIRNAPEKILMLKFKDIIPPTLITRSRKEIDLFMSSCKRSVIKPLYGNGGQGIFLLDKKDKNYNQIIEKFIDEDSIPFIVQKFLPEIIKGDKRIILINGEPVAALKRIPKTNEFRSNIHVGGNTKAVKLSKNDRKICSIIKETLINEKLFFAGIDVIGNYLTEINVTSPTCIQEIKKLHKIDVAKIIFDKLDE